VKIQWKEKRKFEKLRRRRKEDSISSLWFKKICSFLPHDYSKLKRRRIQSYDSRQWKHNLKWEMNQNLDKISLLQIDAQQQDKRNSFLIGQQNYEYCQILKLPKISWWNNSILMKLIALRIQIMTELIRIDSLLTLSNTLQQQIRFQSRQ